MSTAPPLSTPSQLPQRPQEAEQTSGSSDHSDGDRQRIDAALPEPRLRLELRDLRHAATRSFIDNINAAEDVSNLVQTVVKILYYPPTSSNPTSTSSQDPSRPHPYRPHIPDTRSVTLILRDMDGVAYTTGLDLDDDHKEIHFSLPYISSVAARFSPSAHDIRRELLGVICHELVHCYQWNALGTANGGLIEGIADFVRLKAGFVPPHWKREGGKRWDQGYQVTGYFLEWLEGVKGEGGVRRLNQALRERQWDEQRIWTEVYGEEVGVLWGQYCEKLEAEGVMNGSAASASDSASGSDH